MANLPDDANLHRLEVSEVLLLVPFGVLRNSFERRLISTSLPERLPVHEPEPVVFGICQQLDKSYQVLENHQAYLLPACLTGTKMMQVLYQVVHKPAVIQLVDHYAIIDC